MSTVSVLIDLSDEAVSKMLFASLWQSCKSQILLSFCAVLLRCARDAIVCCGEPFLLHCAALCSQKCAL